MTIQGVDPAIVEAWLSARSIVRGLPLPVADHGGFRVDTRSEAEVARWVYARAAAGLETLARAIRKPRHLLKLCGTGEALLAALPAGWTLHPPAYFMRATGEPDPRRLADGYRIEARRVGMVLEARIISETGALAASGYAAETQDVFIYDRIVTEPAHRRKGLGHLLMLTLHAARQRSGNPQLLVATEDGRALYSTLGWETISPYSTASIVAP